MSEEEPTSETLDDLAHDARRVFQEFRACRPVYLGDGVHEDAKSSWNVYAYSNNAYVGTVETLRYQGSAAEYKGVLFGDDESAITVASRSIETVLLHLGIELGRRTRKAVEGE